MALSLPAELAAHLDRPHGLNRYGPGRPSPGLSGAGDGAWIPYVEQLEGQCDVLLLSLGRPNAISLNIAREVHRQKAAFRTVLVIGSFTATVATATLLSGYMAADRSLELPAVLRLLVVEPIPPRLARDVIEREVPYLTKHESCLGLIARLSVPFLNYDELRERDQRYIQQ